MSEAPEYFKLFADETRNHNEQAVSNFTSLNSSFQSLRYEVADLNQKNEQERKKDRQVVESLMQHNVL